jgi:hypothetical protein
MSKKDDTAQEDKTMSNDFSWGKVFMALTIAAGTAAVTCVVKDILLNPKLSPEEKLVRLDAALKAGSISRDEWQKGRDSVMSNYAHSC